MISRAGMGAADLLCESRAPAHGLIARMITATARAIQKTSANLVALGLMSSSRCQSDIVVRRGGL